VATLDKPFWDAQLANLKKVCMGSGHQNVVQIIRRRMLLNNDRYIIDMEVLELSLTNYLYSPHMAPLNLQRDSPYYGNNLTEEKSGTVWEIMSQIASGLRFIHQNDVVHGNLKPSNGSTATTVV
jgi:serine/threonine protein kinase